MNSHRLKFSFPGKRLRGNVDIALLGLCLWFAITGCSRRDADTKVAVPEPDASTEGLRVLGKVPEFDFIDHTRNVYGLSDLKNRVWLANFVFTRCGSTCPLQTAKLTKFQDSLKGEEFWSAVRMLSFSVEPEYDTPEILTQYAATHKATSNWHFLTGEREKIWEFCEKGLMLPVEESGLDPEMPILHSPMVVLVDGWAQIRGYYNGLDDQSLEKLKSDLKIVLEETSSITGYDKIAYPNELITVSATLRDRGERQLAMAQGYDVFHDFRFTDALQRSGVTFRNRVVEDACKINIAGHYDHGNGIAVADVDADGLLDVYLTTQIGSNQLWKNLGDGTYEDITEEHLALADRISVTASFADTDNDGDADLFVTTTRGGNFFFENTGAGRFKDQTVTSGLGYSGHSSSGVFFDYDNDGLLDLFLCNIGVFTEKDKQGEGGYFRVLSDAFAGHLKPAERNEASILYRNDGGNRFVDVTSKTGLVDVSWTGAASPIDLNEDGWQDLYVLNMQGNDEYYENVGGKKFERRSRENFPRTPWGSMGIKVFDFNNDGRMDIFITDMHSDMSQTVEPSEEKKKSNMLWGESFLQSSGRSIFGNAFFRNDGSGKLAEISDAIGVENYWPWGLSVGDLNADGFDDAFVTSSMNYPYLYAVNSVLLNGRGKKFYDCEFVVGVEPRRGGRTARPVFTLDPHGADKDHEMVKLGSLTRPSEMWGALGSRSSVIVDLENDGDLDIFTNEFNDVPMILLSNLTEQRSVRWLKVKLTGSRSNRDGLGAKVVIKSSGSEFTKVYDGQSGYLSQSRYPLYFGLGNTAQVDEIAVHWPSGAKQTIEGPVEPNRLIELVEP